jgi:hypothetical protein
MKLSVTQIVLGTLIVLAAGFTIWWIVFHVAFPMEVSAPGDDGITTRVEAFPEHASLFLAARSGTVIMVLLGLGVMIAGIFQITGGAERVSKLTLLQMVAGVLAAGFAVFIMRWGFPTEYVSDTVIDSEKILRVFINPAITQVYIIYSACIACLLGMAVTGVSIAQLVKLRKKTESQYEE